MHRRHFIAGLGVTMGGASGCASRPGAPVQPSKAQTPAIASDRGDMLSAQTLEDALLGSSYLGCGGGGSLEEARQLIAEDLAAGHVFRKLPVEVLADDERVASPYALASLAPVSKEMQARLDAITPKVDAPTLSAFALLERHLGTKFAAVILGEIGPLSMAEAMSTAARLGVPSLDADTVGRATPEINQHSVRVAGYPLTPAAGVTLFGDEVILQTVQDPSREEDVFRALSVVSSLIGVADAPITGAIAKSGDALITGSLSLAIRIGKAVREARQAGANAILAGRDAGEGYTLFEGTIGTFNWADTDGFLVGDLSLTGHKAFAGQQLILDYKNEHLVARRDGVVIATCPDLITVIDDDTHEGVNNPEFETGRSVTVLGFRADPLWRRPAGLEVFSPRYFGYDVDYVPIEKRLSLL